MILLQGILALTYPDSWLSIRKKLMAGRPQAASAVAVLFLKTYRMCRS
jgi:hypothetical protein